MSNNTLFELSQEALALKAQIDALLEAGEGEVTGEAELLMDTYLEVEEEIVDKFHAYGLVMGEIEGERAALEAQAAVLLERYNALMTRADSKKNVVQRMKDRLKSFMELHGMKKVETPLFTFSVRVNGGRVPVILRDGLDPNDLPPEFQRVRVEPDMNALRAWLEEPSMRGVASKYARLGERGTYLRIS